MADLDTSQANSTTSSDDKSANAGAAAGGADAGAGAAATAAFYEAFANKELAGSPTVQKFKTAEELAAGYVALEKRYGIDPARRIDLPADPNDAEGMRAVYAKLGLPEKPDGYGLKMPDGATDGDKAQLAAFTDTCHKIGVPAGMAKGLFEWWAAEGAKSVEAGQTAWKGRVEEGGALLKTEFGAAYDQKMKDVDTFLARYGYDDLREALKPENRSAYPSLVKMIAQVVERMAEPDGAGGRSGDAAGGFGERPLTPLQAAAAVKALEADPVKGKALFDRSNPQHKAVVEERQRLLAMTEPKAA